MIVYATDLTPNFDLNTTATYSCNDGYTLDLSIGVEVRTCIDDGNNDAVGVFSGKEPACVRKYCSNKSLSSIYMYHDIKQPNSFFKWGNPTKFMGAQKTN